MSMGVLCVSVFLNVCLVAGYEHDAVYDRRCTSVVWRLNRVNFVCYAVAMKISSVWTSMKASVR
jgi:hypothetical protein